MTRRKPWPGLRISWDERESDYSVHYDKSKSDGGWFIYLLEAMRKQAAADRIAWKKPEPRRDDAFWGQPMAPFDALRQELIDRGFDPDTLVISVKRKVEP